ncbi:CCAAT binding transcription factor component, partial [Xylariales sp. PMI_506]
RYEDILRMYWKRTIEHIVSDARNFKNSQIPLARIKRVMKTDPDVELISVETPILFAKACEIFIAELTKRTWVHTEENKRRTRLLPDIIDAVGSCDMFDFLVDIVPR